MTQNQHTKQIQKHKSQQQQQNYFKHTLIKVAAMLDNQVYAVNNSGLVLILTR